MDVVVHQAISEYFYACPFGLYSKQFQIKDSIGIGKKDELLSIPALDDVMGATGDNDSSNSRHCYFQKEERTSASVFSNF